MVNRRFFPAPKQDYDVGTLCDMVAGELTNNDARHHHISDVNTLKDADINHISSFHNHKYYQEFFDSHAGVIIVNKKDFENTQYNRKHAHAKTLILCDNAYYAFAVIGNAFYSSPHQQPLIDKNAIIAPNAQIGKDCHIAAGVVIGDHAVIGDNVSIGVNSVIGENVVIGDDTHIAPNCVLEYCMVGKNCQIHAGAKIGVRGFGFAHHQGQYMDIPQLGAVVIGDRVEIGANSTIDRGTADDTIIGDDVRLDNLVQIAHNVKIDQGCIMAGQVGIAGSSHIGAYTQIGGQGGVSGHLNIGAKNQIGAKSAIFNDTDDNVKLKGSPAINLKQFAMLNGFLNRLTYHDIKILKNILKEKSSQ